MLIQVLLTIMVLYLPYRTTGIASMEDRVGACFWDTSKNGVKVLD